MEEYYFDVPVSNSRVLCIGPITRDEAASVDDDAAFCDGFGYYLYAADAADQDSGIEILAKITSEEAVQRLTMLLAGRK